MKNFARRTSKKISHKKIVFAIDVTLKSNMRIYFLLKNIT